MDNGKNFKMAVSRQIASEVRREFTKFYRVAKWFSLFGRSKKEKIRVAVNSYRLAAWLRGCKTINITTLGA